MGDRQYRGSRGRVATPRTMHNAPIERSLQLKAKYLRINDNGICILNILCVVCFSLLLSTHSSVLWEESDPAATHPQAYTVCCNESGRYRLHCTC